MTALAVVQAASTEVMTPRSFLHWLAGAVLSAGAAVQAADGDELAQVLAQPVYGSSRIASASKYNQDANDTPSIVYVRTGGEIRAQGYRTLAEVLESLPGVHSRIDRAYTYTGVRGISRPGDYSSRLLLMIDGVRVNEAIYDSATAGREFPIDIGLIDRVEYVAGPGSALYGSNAVLGVVNVVTRNPSQLPGWTANAEVASLGGRKLALAWGGSSGPVRVLFGAASEHNRGHRSLSYPEYATMNGGVAHRQDGTRNDKLFVKALWSDWRLSAELSDHVKVDPTGAYGALFNRRSFSGDRYALTDLAFARPVGVDHEVFARIGLAYYRYYGYGDYGDAGAPVPSESVSRASWWSGELRYVWAGWAGHRILVGTELQNNFRQFIWVADLEPAPSVQSDLHTQSSRWSLFVNDEWQVTQTLRLNLGLRADRRLDRRHMTTPRLAALWAPSPQWTFKLQHGSAFREPNASETSATYGNQVPSVGLRVESMRANELSALWRPRAGLDLSTTAYVLDIRDSITLVNLPDGSDQYRNAGRIRSRGLEVEATQVFDSGLQARASWSLQQGVDRETGAVLSDSPRSLFKLMVSAPGPWAGTRIGANLLRVGERRTLSDTALAPYVRLSAHVSHAPAGQPWSLGFGVYNLTDRRYADPGGPEHLQDAIAQDGRTWRLQLSRVF
jgi:outer membrane receptor protein involved in Fe transport